MTIVPIHTKFVKNIANNALEKIYLTRKQLKEKELNRLTTIQWYRPWKLSLQAAQKRVEQDELAKWNMHNCLTEVKIKALINAAQLCKGNVMFICDTDAALLAEWSKDISQCS